MKEKEKKSVLQLLYAGQLIKHLDLLCTCGTLALYTRECALYAPVQAKALREQFSLHTVNDVFSLYNTLYGFARWKKSGQNKGVSAYTTQNCKLCNIAKYSGTASPCELYCVTPMQALIQAIAPELQVTVQSTLWEEDSCTIVLTNMTEKELRP